LLEYLC